MNFLRLSAILLFSTIALAQAPANTGLNVLVVPFENQSQAPGIAWISDSFPELLQGRLNSAKLFVLPREDRIRAYDRLGIPVELHPSRATLYRIAEQLDVDYAVLGLYRFDGRTFTATAQLLDMRRQHLLPEMNESGPLIQLIDILTALAWDILHALRLTSRSPSKPMWPGRLRSAWMLSKTIFAALLLQLRRGRFSTFVKPFASVPSTPKHSCNWAKPTIADDSMSKQSPRSHAYPKIIRWRVRRTSIWDLRLTTREIFREPSRHFTSSLHACLWLRFTTISEWSALTETEKAPPNISRRRSTPIRTIPIITSIWRSNSTAPATWQALLVNCAIRCRYGPATALRSLCWKQSRLTSAPPLDRSIVPATQKTPVERIRANYDESSFRQLALKIEAAAEQRLSKTDPKTHAQFHADRGHQLLAQGFLSEAENEFREAITLNPSNPEAHAGLASVLEAENNPTAARAEANDALRLREFPEPLLVLAKLDLRDNRTEAAAESIDRALRLEPPNASALALKRAIAAKLAQEAQPLPNR